MLEILALLALTKRIGTALAEKNRASGWFKFLTVVLWFVGEFVGAVVGVIASAGAESSQCLIYGFALGGAAIGAAIAYAIATNAAPGPPVPVDLVQANPTPVGPTSPAETSVQSLKNLKEMLEANLISEAEYETKKAEILAKM